jgi:carbamoyl-phosphate synthase small subunit
MISKENKPAVLVLANGRVFHGVAIGKIGTSTGEICFNTGMTGYQEIFTDPSYFGQIMVTATSHIGNYGVHEDEIESDSLKISGLVCKKFSPSFSRPSSKGSLQDEFLGQNFVGIADVDTRALVRHIRDEGAMNAIISSEELDVEILKAKLNEIPSMDGLELASKVSTKAPYIVGDEDTATYRVSLLDLGVKKNIVRCLVERGCVVKVYPHNATVAEMAGFNPDGFMLSNGPGDPSVMNQEIAVVKELTNGDIPIFGICLGHQVLALSQGLTTEKMHNGHRGINHPVKNLLTGKCEITSQNHGFVVSLDSIENNADIEMTHQHLNDGTVAGIRMTNKSIFSVQYHPESSPGPNDSRYLFDEFISNMKIYKNIAIKHQA